MMVTTSVTTHVPWDMLYADDLILSDISSTNLQKRFGEWQEALESKGLKVNADKTDTMVCARTAETLQIKDKTGKALKQVENFRYLGSVIHAHGGSEEDIKARIAAAWKNGKSYQECCVIEECPLVLKEKYIEQW